MPGRRRFPGTENARRLQILCKASLKDFSTHASKLIGNAFTKQFGTVRISLDPSGAAQHHQVPAGSCDGGSARAEDCLAVDGRQLPAPRAGINRIWCFAGAEYDEARRELRVGGNVQSIEPRPLALLQELLSRGGEVATRRELLDAVWGRETVPQSLTTAVGKLRVPFGDLGREVIEAVHGIGYRIGVPVELRAAPERPRLALNLRAGDEVPNRPQWRLVRVFGAGENKDVWLASHIKTGELRVFKFADTEDRLDALKREAALSRILREALGNRPDLMAISEWNLDRRPYFLESPYGGPNLAEWAASQGGIAEVPLGDRVAMVARIARTVAAAHGVGVLHRDIKPTNVLVGGSESEPVLRLVDFGSGRLTDVAQPGAVTVTGLGLTADATDTGGRITGTLRYLAPEMLAGGAPTVAADVYALGILLYQMIVGDFDAPLVAGWDNNVPDPLLREDVTAAAAGDPARRLASAPALAERLESLEARRAEQERLRRLKQDSDRLAAKLRRARERRPWIAASLFSLAVGLALAVGFGVSAGRDRDVARREAATASAVNRFLMQDLLGRGNPVNSGKPNETLMESATAAEPRIETRFARQPMVAASIYLTLGGAYESRSAFDAARNAYAKADAAFVRAEGAHSADEVMLLLRRAHLEALSRQDGASKRATVLLAAAVPRISLLGPRISEAIVWLLDTRQQLDMAGDDEMVTLREVTAAADLADTMPSIFEEQFRIALRLDEAVTLLLVPKLDEADALLERLRTELLSSFGPRHPDTLLVQLQAARVLLERHRYVDTAAALDRLLPLMVAVFGPDHSETMMTRFILSQALGQLGDYDRAVRDDVALYVSAVAKQGKNSFFAVSSLVDMSTWYCRKGDGQAGLAVARRAYDAARTVSGETSSLTQFVLANVALCQTVLRQYPDARATVDRIDVQKTAQADDSPEEFVVLIDLIKAEGAAAAGHTAEASRLLELPSLVLSRPGADDYLSRWSKRLSDVHPVTKTLQVGGAQP